MLCDKCGQELEGPSGRCPRCDFTAPHHDVARTPSCAICSAPLQVDTFGAIICTGCNRSEQLCGCGPNGIKQGFEPEPVNVSPHTPDSSWWLHRLEHLMKTYQKERKGLNRDGDYLLKFAMYSVFCDLCATAIREATPRAKRNYERAVKLVEENRPTL